MTGVARHGGRYDRVARDYSRVRPRYPRELVAHLAGLVMAAPAADDALALDIGSGTGAFTRQLRAALPDTIRVVGVEPGAAMRAQAAAETEAADGIALVEGAAEAIPCADGAAIAVVAATAVHWFDRPVFYREARRVLVPGGVLAVVEYLRDTEHSALAAALVGFMAEYGSRRAYVAADYRPELAALPGFAEPRDFGLPQTLRLTVDQFIGLALSSSHAAGVIDRFGEEGARQALAALASPYRIDAEHVSFGYLFQCISVRLDLC